MLRPDIQVSDRGSSPNSATCEVIFRLFDLETTVNVVLLGALDNFRSDVFEQLIGNILELDATVTQFEEINSTHYYTQLYGQSQGVFVPAAVLSGLLSNISAANLQRLRDAGFTIVTITSNGPTESPTNFIPVRQIPIWAVAVIVVVNSVILISVLFLIVIILWKRYAR